MQVSLVCASNPSNAATDNSPDGFMMDTNSADHVLLDAFVLKRLSAVQQEVLEDVGFLGFVKESSFSKAVS